MWTIIDITERGTYLRILSGQLGITKPDEPKRFVPVRDIAVLLLTEQAVGLTAAVLAELASQGALVIVCNRTQQPVALLQPLHPSSTFVRTRAAQAEAGAVIKKRLWQSLVRRKILSQAQMLKRLGRVYEDVQGMVLEVKSGDSDNQEARAARYYWNRLGLFPVRNREAEDANQLFNYAYMVLYAIVARAICATGLDPSLGLHHHNQYNAFCLASDLMEPYRVVADRAVLDWLQAHPGETAVTREAKGALISTMKTAKLSVGGMVQTLSEAVSISAVSLRESILSGHDLLALPELAESAEVAPCG